MRDERERCSNCERGDGHAWGREGTHQGLAGEEMLMRDELFKDMDGERKERALGIASRVLLNQLHEHI